jgi:hypothetical protein
MAAALCKKHGKAWGLPCGDYAAVELYSRYENGFAPKFYTKNHHFSKTGSGQTQKNLKKKTALFFSCSMGAQLLSMGGEFVSVMNTWQDANNVFDRVLDETYGPFASPTAPDEAAALLAESRLLGQVLAANDAPRVATTEQAYAVQDAMIAEGASLGAKHTSSFYAMLYQK